jgi:uncharacterized protein YecE (DUF72 family)
MRFHAGTSGYSYNAWKRKFYPAKLPASEMLGYYAQHFSTVEINSTFRGLPEASVVTAWSEQVPASFRFALKAPQTITHRKRLKNVRQETKAFLKLADVLGRRRGPLLFQLPPNFKKDVPRLEGFLKLVADQKQVAFEFRHESWFDDEVFDCLSAASCALCMADTDEAPITKVTRTTNWGYVRLRRERYSAKQLGNWIDKLQGQRWKEAYVFFRHEETGTGPKFARRFLELAESARG